MTNGSGDPALIICDGSLGGLIACWAESVARAETTLEGGAVKTIAWMPTDDLPARGRREVALKRQAQMCGLNTVASGNAVIVDPSALSGRTQRPGAASEEFVGLGATALLMSAAAQASALGLRRVIWPVHSRGLNEPDLEWLSELTDRAMLVGQLATIDLPRVVEGNAGGTLRIETPYADFGDGELLELALDMDVPIGAAWWCEREQDAPCGVCPECSRWRAALEQVDPQGLVNIAGLSERESRRMAP